MTCPPPVVRLAVAAAVSFFLHPSAALQAAEEKAAFDKSKAVDGGLGMPTPFDKFLALDAALPKGKVDWEKAYRGNARDIDPDDFKDKEVGVPMALGVRIADGVMAVKAKNAELLNACATDIEKLAQKIGVAESELTRARAVRTAGNKGEWLKVFMELGFFQQDIMKRIEEQKSSSRGTLLIVTGWMQGARFTAGLVEENYTPALSNLLREPMLAKALRAKIEALPAETKAQPGVAKIREVLPRIVQILDIPTEGTITREKVTELKNLATEVVNAATRPAR
jgi:hypothetical protein